MRKPFLVLAAWVALAVVVPATANASTVHAEVCDSGALYCRPTLEAQPGETNNVKVTAESEGILIEDTAGVDTVAEGPNQLACDVVSPTAVRCPDPMGEFPRVFLTVGDQDDTVVAINQRAEIAVSGGTGDDRVVGNQGDDSMIGNAGADKFYGAGGHDTADYSDRRAPVQVRIGKGAVSGNAADGPKGRRDTIDSSVEEVDGGAGDDLLKGTDGINWLRGGAGDDKLVGFFGHDLFDGGEGNDVLNARADDQDTLIDCGPGSDKARIDRRDPKPVACERIKSR